MSVIGDIIIDGDPVAAAEASVSALDIGFQRGYGCFEALRSYGGRAFRMDAHLDRLARSAERLHLPAFDRRALADWVVDRAAAGGDCIVRVFLTGGIDPMALGTHSTIVVLAEELPPARTAIRIEPLPAPWHSDGAESELTGAKTLSYGPNLAAYIAAHRHGFDDALLIGRNGLVLEGPTFSVGWVHDGVIETPGLEQGILESITRTAALEVAADLGIPVSEGVYLLDRLLAADEVFVLSTVKEVMPVVAVGDTTFVPGPVTQRLGDGFDRLVAVETGG